MQHIIFDDYQAVTSALSFFYTPGQNYLSEPNRKVVLGSRYPTFELTYKKGWDPSSSSAVNWDYLEAGMGQQLTLGTLGNSNILCEWVNSSRQKKCPS